MTQAGEQSNNIARNAWLARGAPWEVAGTTVDTPVQVDQPANHIVAAFVKAGTIDAGIHASVEVIAASDWAKNVIHGPGFFQPQTGRQIEPDQFQAGGRRIAEKPSSRTEVPDPVRPAISRSGRSALATRVASRDPPDRFRFLVWSIFLAGGGPYDSTRCWCSSVI